MKVRSTEGSVRTVSLTKTFKMTSEQPGKNEIINTNHNLKNNIKKIIPILFSYINHKEKENKWKITIIRKK